MQPGSGAGEWGVRAGLAFAQKGVAFRPFPGAWFLHLVGSVLSATEEVCLKNPTVPFVFSEPFC